MRDIQEKKAFSPNKIKNGSAKFPNRAMIFYQPTTDIIKTIITIIGRTYVK